MIFIIIMDTIELYLSKVIHLFYGIIGLIIPDIIICGDEQMMHLLITDEPVKQILLIDSDHAQ
jgi:hypothetical protein